MLQFDWTTFCLEVLNFLVLVWILQRLLYRPVLNLLDARQQKIRDESDQAVQLRAEAEALRKEYDSRIQNLTTEQDLLHQKLEQELAQARAVALDELKQTLVDEAAKFHSRNTALNTANEAIQLQKARAIAYQQAAGMLFDLATPQLTHSIAQVFLHDLSRLQETDQERLHKAALMAVKEGEAIEVISAHPLAAEDCSALRQAISGLAGLELQFSFTENPELIAGIRVLAGECLLHANLVDELKFFSTQIRYE
jgi:F-type H+-transporting ATPase subunit b